MLRAQEEAKSEVREPGNPARGLGVTWRRVIGAVQVATETRKLYRSGF
jgi:hypothetical protein